MLRILFARPVLAPLTALTLFGLVACGGGDDDGPTDPISTSTVRVELTDAPGNLAAAWVEIPQIALTGTGGQTLLRDAAQGNLFDLAQLDGVTVEVANKGGIIPGTYGQLRLVIDRAEIETTSGDVFTRNGGRPTGPAPVGELTCDTCNRAPQGIPAFIGGGGLTLEGGETVTLVLDFDAFRSFTRTEAGWDMTPVASVAVKSEAATVSGTVEVGELAPVPGSCGGRSTVESFRPLLIDRDNSRATWAGRAGADGSYEVEFVPPGNYEVTHVQSIEFDNERLTLSANSTSTTGVIQVEPGQQVNVDYQITGGSCDPL